MCDRIEFILASLPRVGGILAVLFLDVDGFKAINDTFGHDVGDQLLITLAARLRDVCRPPTPSPASTVMSS